MMQAPKVNVTREELLDPAAPVWQKAKAENVKLSATPLALQPSSWIQGAFKNYRYGRITSARLQALHNGNLIAVRVEWSVPEQASTTDAPDEFTDACAVMLPFVRNAPFMTMGNDHEWVNMWLWRADRFGPFTVTAAGIGTTERISDGVLDVQGIWRDGHWHVAFVRPLNPGKPREHVPLEVGTPWQINLALWQGSNQERGGLKSFGGSWTELELES